MTGAMTLADAEQALNRLSLSVRQAAPEARLKALREGAFALLPHVREGYLNPAVVEDEIYGLANDLIPGEPGGPEEIELHEIASAVTMRIPLGEEPPPEATVVSEQPPLGTEDMRLSLICPAQWRDVPLQPMRWFAQDRIPAGDVTLYAGNGGSGKTETLVGLLVSAAAGLGDWLGCVLETGPVLFLSCEEPEENIRDRVERICKHRGIDPYSLSDLYIHCPDLEATALVSVNGRTGTVVKSEMFKSVIEYAKMNKPACIAIDSAAAVFDGDNISRRLVRSFVGMLRKLAIETGAAVVLLDHPSVRGMADGSGTAGSVDWRNSVRSMMFLSDPDKDDPDVRTLEFKKSNRGKQESKVRLRWNGLTFSTEASAQASPYRAAANREVDELFLRLLDKRNAQGRPVRPSSGRGSAPAEMADDPEAGGVKGEAFRAAMERLFTVGRIKVVETGSPKKRVKHIERAMP